jgi:hypothetical protein
LEVVQDARPIDATTLGESLEEDADLFGILLQDVGTGFALVEIVVGFNLLLPIRAAVEEHTFKVIICTALGCSREWQLFLIGVDGRA